MCVESNSPSEVRGLTAKPQLQSQWESLISVKQAYFNRTDSINLHNYQNCLQPNRKLS